MNHYSEKLKAILEGAKFKIVDDLTEYYRMSGKAILYFMYEGQQYGEIDCYVDLDRTQDNALYCYKVFMGRRNYLCLNVEKDLQLL